jgi:hypothetical protein
MPAARSNEVNAERNATMCAAKANGSSYRKIGRTFGVSGERVRQIVIREERRKASNARIRAE